MVEHYGKPELPQPKNHQNLSDAQNFNPQSKDPQKLSEFKTDDVIAIVKNSLSSKDDEIKKELEKE